MVISQIGRQNNTISFKSSNQKSLENFSDADLYSMANTSDEFLKNNSFNQEAQKYIQDPMRKVERRTGQVIPVADTLLTAALTPGSFGDKVMAGVGRAGFWTIFGGITNKLSTKLNQNETYRNFSQENPATASLVGSVVVSSVGILGGMAAKIGFNKLLEKYKPAQNFIKSIHNDLSKIPLGKKISEFADKNRKYTAIGAIAGFVGVTGLVVNKLVSLAKVKKNADEKLAQYNEIRLDASRELNNRLLTAQTNDKDTAE